MERTIRHPTRALAGIALAIFVVGCGPESEESIDSSEVSTRNGYLEPPTDTSIRSVETHLVASIDRPDQTVRFYEPEPGSILIVELGNADALDGRKKVPRGAWPSERYEALAGLPAPKSLRDAETRMTAKRGDRSPRGPEEGQVIPTAAPALTTKSLSNDRTREQFMYLCYNYGENYNWLWVTGTGIVGQKNDRDSIDAAAMADIGTIHHTVKRRPWYTWIDMADVDVPQGWYSYVSYFDPNTDFDCKASVTQADGDTYDMCTMIN